MILFYQNINQLPILYQNTKRIILEGSKLSNLNDTYSYLKTELNLPEYFGNNLDALADTLIGDLNHLNENQIEIIITEQEKFLQDETTEVKQNFIDTIAYAADELEYLYQEDDTTKIIQFYVQPSEELKEIFDDNGYVFDTLK